MSLRSTTAPGPSPRAIGLSTPVATGLILFLFLGAIVGDLPWQERLGTLTRSPMLFIAPPIALILLFTRPRWSSLERQFGAYWAITTLWALAMLAFYLVGGGHLDFGGRNLFIRVFTTSAENFTFFCALFALGRLIDLLTVEQFWKISFTIFLLLCLIAAIEIASKESLAWLHSNVSAAKTESRLSLLTSEPSQAFPVFVGFYALTICLGIYLMKRPTYAILLTSLFLGLGLKVASKGGIPILALAMLVPMPSLLSHDRPLAIRVLALSLPVMALFGFALAQATGDIRSQVEDFTSFSTRVVGVSSCLFSLIHYPLGVGYGTFFIHYPPLVSETAHAIQGWISLPINLEEVFLMAGTGESLGAKAGLPNQIVFNGLFAVIFFGTVVRDTWIRVRALWDRPSFAYWATAFFLFMIFTFGLVADGNTLYVYLLPILLIERSGKALRRQG